MYLPLCQEKTEKEITKMFELINKFKEMTYEERVQLIKERYGELNNGKVIYFGTENTLTITKDAEGKYHFEFNIPNVDSETIKKHVPEDAEKLFAEYDRKVEEKKKEYTETIVNALQNSEKLITSENINKQMEYSRYVIEQQAKKKKENEQSSSDIKKETEETDNE